MSHAAMTSRLNGRTILITGASSGIGRSTALEFARTAPKDLRLILTARRVERVEELAAQIKKEVGDGVKVLAARLDMTKPNEIAKFVDGLQGEWRHVDGLVNNAGMVLGTEKAPSILPSDIDTMLATNVTGLMQMTQSVLALYRSRETSHANAAAFPDQSAPFGDIINVGSIAGREGYPGGSIYCATKAAVRAFTDALRKELIDTRIRVMEVDPGQVETEFSVVRFRGDQSKADAVYKGCEPLTPEDIAEAIVWMAGRRQNVVVADTLIFPSHQAAATVMHKKS